ncbi:DUF5987 family protein [Actinomadura fibrosa]|uniref:DUF5987 family protein n=1 Tax=Actinomadura fibrosa TaxID=111802 RepID=A0ABW2Y0Y1_9ACTN|nr:DUF5987 family protein [Actinomadura fibrosa]
MDPAFPYDDGPRTTTLEAFADTIIPGARRTPGDRAVAGAAPGPGAVEAGALTLLDDPATGIGDGLDDLVRRLNEHAREHLRRREPGREPGAPAFAALPFTERTALVKALTAPGHPEREAWIGVALFCFMAFDSAAHLHTRDALAAGHPGLRTLGLADPDPDGLWRFPAFSYRCRLADPHPATTASGSPA